MDGRVDRWVDGWLGVWMGGRAGFGLLTAIKKQLFFKIVFYDYCFCFRPVMVLVVLLAVPLTEYSSGSSSSVMKP